MIAKKHQGVLRIFEKSTGMTAVFSGQELALLAAYLATGKQTPFIKRLYDLGILVDAGQLETISQAMQGECGTSLEALHIELTDKCPLSCPQCYKDNKQASEMPFPVLVKLVQEAQKLNLFQIALGGGEPLVYSKLLVAVKLIAKTQMAVSLTTSGYGLNKKLLDDLLLAGLNHMQISLNSLDEKTNRTSRDGYEYAVAALNLLAASKLSFGINYVARQDNFAAFEQLVNYACEIGADNINVLRYKPSGHEDYQRNALTVQQIVALAECVSRVRGIKIKVDSAYSQLLVYLHGKQTDPLRSGCGAGSTFLAVTPEGRFSPCSHLPLAVWADNLGDYLVGQDLAAFLVEKNKLTGICGCCLHSSLCGGCRAVCLALSGQINAGEQECLAFEEEQTCSNIGKVTK